MGTSSLWTQNNSERPETVYMLPNQTFIGFDCYACPTKGNESCRYFEWMDYDVSERVAKVIRGLLKRANNYEKEIEKLNLTVEKKDLEIHKKSRELSNQYIAHNRLLHHFPYQIYASEYEYLMPPTVIYFFVVDVGSLAAIKSETVRIALAPAVLLRWL
nr:zinc finger, GRF-type [Ipomoea batatas]